MVTNNNSSVSRNTNNIDNNQNVQKFKNSLGSNILNGYRSVTYNFTLAGLPKSYASDPEKYREGELKYIILKSGGKPTTGFSKDVESLSRKKTQLVSLANDPYQYEESFVVDDIQTGKALVDGFNKNSAGRFDMFIENVQIDNLMAFSNDSSVSLPTQIKFDIIEPYSINGFIEALHVAAVATGYSSYVHASFLLKIEFQGIPDTNDVDNPVKIPNSTRYFPIAFTNVQVELTERGTKYICSAVPFNERAFGQPNVIKKPIKMKGKTIKDILDNLAKSLNQQIIENSQTTDSEFDEYKVEFVEWNKKWVVNPDSVIAKSEILNIFEDNSLYNFALHNDGKNAYKSGNPPREIKYNPSETVINFPENSGVHEVIAAVIRDSNYVRKILKSIDSGDKSSFIDAEGYVDYFSVRLEVENKKTFDLTSKRPYQIFKYVISPYKIHFTRIPLYTQVKLKEEEFIKLVKRQYNYIYMGNNVDVINFKLNFNTLYFEALPMSLGNQDYPIARDTLKFERKIVPNFTAEYDLNELITDNEALPTPTYKYISNSNFESGNAVPYQNDPYSVVAKTMHEAVINSKASMITGEIELLGDPYYLVTGGFGGYNPEESQNNNGTIGDGEAARDYGEVNILINFRNPIDIESLENGGSLYFSPQRASFSGVYTVTKVTNMFKNGVFSQRLEILRKPGQILDKQFNEIKLSDTIGTKEIENSKPIDINVQSLGYSQRLDSASIADLLNRANPSVGIPSLPSNFSNNPGGLGGDNKSVFNRTPGLAQQLINTTPALSNIGQVLPADQFSETRLNLLEFAKLTQNNLGSSALLSAASNIITGNIPTPRVLGQIVGNVLGNSINNALKKSNIGSGIGEGAPIKINPSSVIPSTVTALDLKFGINDDPSKLLAGTVSNIKTAIEDLGSNAISSINRLGQDAAKLVNGIGQKIDSSLGTLADPKSLAAKLNLDPSKLSGLSNNLQSKLAEQVEKLSKEIPKNLELSQAVDLGVALDVLPRSSLPNIPPLQPFKTANLPDVIASSQRLTKAYTDKFSTAIDSKILTDKKETFKKQISQVTGQLNIAGENIKTSVNAIFNSKNSISNPLDNLINKLNDPKAEPYTGTDPIVRARLGLPPIKE